LGINYPLIPSAFRAAATPRGIALGNKKSPTNPIAQVDKALVFPVVLGTYSVFISKCDAGTGWISIQAIQLAYR